MKLPLPCKKQLFKIEQALTLVPKQRCTDISESAATMMKSRTCARSKQNTGYIITLVWACFKNQFGLSIRFWEVESRMVPRVHHWSIYTVGIGMVHHIKNGHVSEMFVSHIHFHNTFYLHFSALFLFLLSIWETLWSKSVHLRYSFKLNAICFDI